MNRVVFIFDRVAHYHRDLFKSLETALLAKEIELILLSGDTQAGATGRVGLKDKVISNEHKYRFKEYAIGSYTFRTAIDVPRLVASIRPDVVVCMGHIGNIGHWRLIQQKQKLGYRLVVWQCGYEYNSSTAKAFLLRKFVPKFDHHLAYHSNARAYAIQHGAAPSQVTLMHNTINEERITIVPKTQARQMIARKHPEIGSRKILLFVGAILIEKKIEIILAALDCLARSDIVLLLVGDGEHLPTIRAACRGRDDVVITGSVVEGVGPYFDAAEMYLLPGTGGLGINEAMAHGLPVVSGFADGSADDLVVDGKNGFRLRDNTPRELAARIVDILDNQHVAARMGEISREWITGRFAFKEFIHRIASALETQVRTARLSTAPK